MKHDKRFFESTRGQMILLLRGSAKTVNELAADLGLTDNAVRAHLLTLERDGLVAMGTPVKGFRKPHNSYELTDEAQHLFPKPYDALFTQLLNVLKRRMVTPVIRDILSELGHRVGKGLPSSVDDLDSDLATVTETLGELGGAARVVRGEGKLEIKSENCPFADAVAEHPEVCRMAESLVSEIVKRPVKETCDRTGKPKCSFEIMTDQSSSVSGSDESSSGSTNFS
jgi:predicted ArsR family transcriptional regulator